MLKIVALSILGLILLSLAGSMFFLTRDDGKGTRVVTGLTFRIGLSVLLFLILIGGALFNLIEPNTLVPATMLPAVQ